MNIYDSAAAEFWCEELLGLFNKDALGLFEGRKGYGENICLDFWLLSDGLNEAWCKKLDVSGFKSENCCVPNFV